MGCLPAQNGKQPPDFAHTVFLGDYGDFVYGTNVKGVPLTNSTEDTILLPYKELSAKCDFLTKTDRRERSA
jgi:hypothetical protein